MNDIIAFFNALFFTVMGALSTLFIICSFAYTCWLVITGVFPVWYRLGMGLSKRRIAVFADEENFSILRVLLVDSGIFKYKNVIQIHKSNLKRAEKETIFLVHWKDYQEFIDDILKMKGYESALVVYAPQNGDEGKLKPEDMAKISEACNAVVVNFRGRLLNDILTSLITTSYNKNKK